MKWFKHFTNCSRDEKIIRLKSIYGFEGVGRWWELVQLIAEQMDQTERCEVTYNPGFITRSLGFRSVIDARSFLDRLAIDCGLISVRFGNEWVVRCDKLLKLRGRNFTIERDKSTLEEVDVEEDHKKKIITPISPKGIETVSLIFERFWKEVPKKVAKEKCRKIWISKKLDSKIDTILAALEVQKKSDQWVKDGGQFIPHPTTWLNQERWNDEIQRKKTWEEIHDENLKAKGML